MFPKSKRFEEKVSCAPGVGLYDVTKGNKSDKAGASFIKGKRFLADRPQGPGPADLDISAVSLSSSGNLSMSRHLGTLQEFATPLVVKKKSKNTMITSTPDHFKNKELTQEIRRLQMENTEIEKQLVCAKEQITKLENQIKTNLQEKRSLETSIVSLQKDLKELKISTELPARKEVSRLASKLEYTTKTFQADLDLAHQNNADLQEQNTNLDKLHKEVLDHREKLEEENTRLHGLVAELGEGCQTLKDNLEETQDKCQEFSSKLEQANTDLDEMNSKLALVTSEKASLESKLEFNEQEIVLKIEALKNTEDNLKIITNQAAELTNHNHELASQLQQSKDANSELISRLDERIQLGEKIQQKKTEVENKLCKVQEEVLQLTEKEKQLAEDARVLSFEKDAISVQFDNSRKEFEQQLRCLNQETDYLKEQLQTEKNIFLEKFDDNEKQWKQQVSLLEKHRVNIEMEKSTLAEKLQESQKEWNLKVSDCEEKNKELQDHLQEQKDALSELDNSRKELEQQLRCSNEENDYLKEQLQREKNIFLENIDNNDRQWKQQVSLWEEKYKHSQEHCAKLETERTSLAEKLQDSHKEWSLKVSVYEEKNKELQHHLQTYEKEIVILQQRILESQDLHQRKITELVENANKAEQEFDRILSMKQEALSEIDNSKKEFEQQLRCSKEENKSLKEQLLREKNIFLENIDNSDRQWKQQVSLWEEKYKDSQEHCENVETERTSLAEKLQDSDKEWSLKVSVYEEKNKELQDHLQKTEELLTNNLKAMTVKYEILEDTFGMITNEMSINEESHKSEVHTLQKALDERQRDCEQMQTAFNKVHKEEEMDRKERDQLVAVSQNLVEELHSAKNRVDFLEEELSQVRSGTAETVEKLQSEQVLATVHLLDNSTRLEHEIKSLKQQIVNSEELYQRKIVEMEEEACEVREESESTEKLLCQIEMWKQKCAALEEKIGPFAEQLDAFEAEKKALLHQNSEALHEVSKLSGQYANLLGHQNQKQKIHHISKIKQENLSLKKENIKYRDLCDKHKNENKKLKASLSELKGQRKFDPSNSFSHVLSTQKENVHPH